jgi:tryptophan synthase alpha chain
MRLVTKLPLAVGFGISRPEQARQAASLADAVVVGSAIVRLIADHANAPNLEQRLEDFARQLKEPLLDPRKVENLAS